MKRLIAACLLCVGLAGCVVIATGGPREGSGGIAGRVSRPDTDMQPAGSKDAPAACSSVPGKRC
jgi:hypothetical protein